MQALRAWILHHLFVRIGGYCPTAEGFDQGGYEPHNPRLLKGVAEQLVAGI